MKPPRRLRRFILVTFSLANVALAADITWQAPQTLSAFHDVSPLGTLVFAKDQGFSETTVHGVRSQSIGDASAYHPADFSQGTFSYGRHSRALTRLTYSVWFSTDLSTWAEDPGTTQGAPSVPGEVETVPVTPSRNGLTQPRLFIRVQAQ